MSVIHWSEKPNYPALCGQGYRSDKPHCQDKTKVTCKKCLRWLEYYKNKKH
jgi:hypothetical protein